MIYLSKAQKRYRRAFQRCMLGGTINDGRYLLLTLTTPETFDGDLHSAWEKWRKRMKRRGVDGAYFAVKEFNKKKTCTHLHVLMRMGYLDYRLALKQWRELTGARMVFVKKTYGGMKGISHYLGKYINKAHELIADCRSYWYSQSWIYRKWRFYSKKMFGYGEPVDVVEHHCVHFIEDAGVRLEYLNERLMRAWRRAVRRGEKVDLVVC